MVSRVESGKRTTTKIEIANYTAVCGVVGAEQQEFLDLVVEPDDYRIKAHPGQIPDELRTLIFHESTAETIESFQPVFIPGILQTEDYARALFYDLGFDDPMVVENGIRNRLARRIVLTRNDPAQCTFLVHEHALRGMVGSSKIMNDQMLHLVFASGRPQCSIRVIPASLGARGNTLSSFQIFGYAEDSPVVYLEQETTSTFLESRADLATYRRTAQRLANVALSDAQSREFFTRMASEYEGQGAPNGGGLAEE